MRRAILIMGMHRSGTSLLTRSLNLAGLSIGDHESLIDPQPDNPTGFWEQLPILSLHDELLAELGLRWDTPLPLPRDWQQTSIFERYAKRLDLLLTRLFKEEPLFAVKDPRLCLLLPLWQYVAHDRGIELNCVWIRRPADQVAQSLASRELWPLAQSFGVFTNYVLSGLNNLGTTPCAFLDFSQLVTNPHTQLAVLAETLTLNLQEVSSPVREGLVHHGKVGTLTSQCSLPGSTALAESFLLRVASESDITKDMREGLDKYTQESSLFADWFVELWHTRERLKTTLQENADLRHYNQLQTTQLQQLHDSHSWKVTQPLRRVAAWMRKEDEKP